MKLKKAKITILILLFVSLLSIYCASSQPTVTEDEKPERWILERMNGNPLLEGTQITLNLDDSAVNGSAGCNSYNAEIELDETAINISNISYTERACFDPEGIWEQESQYLSLLSSVNSYEKEIDTLILMIDENPVLTFRIEHPAPTACLSGQLWVLETIVEGEVARPAMSDQMTIRLVDNSVNITTGCNSISGTYTSGESSININLELSDMTECPDESSSNLETTFLNIIDNAIEYSITEDRLSIMDNNGNKLYFMIAE